MECRLLKFVDVFTFHPYKEFDSFGDGVLITEDGSKFNIQRSLLASRCPFFKALFCGYFADGTEVLLKGISAEILDIILVYLYTESIHLSEDTVIDVFVASDYLLIDPLMQECRYFFLRQITPSNCISFFMAAWSIERLGILNNCYRFIVIHFEEVVLLSEEIGSLPFEALKIILGNNGLNVSEERTVWNAIVKWIEFDLPNRLQLVPELLKYINLEDTDEALTNDIILHSMIRENNFCLELLFSEFSQLQDSAHIRNLTQTLNSISVMEGSRIPTSMHFITHYCLSHTGCGNSLYLTSDEEIDYWRKVDNVYFFPDRLIQFGRYVYMFDTSIDMSLAFDMLDEICRPMVPISHTRRHYSVVLLNGFIYVLGGVFDNDVEDIEKFDPNTEEWEFVSSLVPMYLSEAVVMNGFIYAIGHVRDEPNPVMMFQVYNPTSNMWSSVSAPKLFRPEVTAVAFHGHLFIIGGEVFDSGTRSAEEYDPEKDVWIPIPDLPVSYLLPRAIVLKDVLIVHEENHLHRSCGGNIPPVYWDSGNRSWHIIHDSSPLRMIHMYRICPITEPNIIKDIVKQNRRENKRWTRSHIA